MAGKITVIDVATTNWQKDYQEKVPVSKLLEDMEVDVSESNNMTIRVIGIGEVELDTMVDPGSTVLITRNIDGG